MALLDSLCPWRNTVAGSASAILGFADMFSAGFVAPLVGIGGESTGIPMGVVMIICAVLSLALYYTMIANKD